MKYRLLHLGNDLRLARGEYLIGRAPQCAIHLEDPTVSRHHAVLRVEEDSAELEDLGSRNGLQVNGETLAGRLRLKSGDCIKIAQHDLILVEGASPRANDTTAKEETNQPEDTLALLGELADKAMTLGNPLEAERILKHYLDGVLRRARDGAAFSPQLIKLCLQYAVRLAGATRRGRWLSYVFELCNALRQEVPHEVMERLYAAATQLEGLETRALSEYIETQGERRSSMAPRQRFDLGRAEGLLRLLQR